MKIVGLTGGIGSGKSTVAGMLERRGARVLDADRIVRELYQGGEVPGRIEARLGEGLVRADGSVDRVALGQLVFASPAARRKLEEIVHPEVRKAILRRIEQWRGEGFPGLVVIDAALLVESEFEYPLDALLVVSAAEPVRLERLEARGVTREEARRRMRAQASDDDKRARADLVIENDGTLQDLERQVDRAVEELGGTEGFPHGRLSGRDKEDGE